MMGSHSAYFVLKNIKMNLLIFLIFTQLKPFIPLYGKMNYIIGYAFFCNLSLYFLYNPVTAGNVQLPDTLVKFEYFIVDFLKSKDVEAIIV